MIRYFLRPLFFLAIPITSYAVFPFNISTDGSGAISDGSWSGNGAVQANVSTTTHSPVDDDMLIDDFGSGTLNLSDINVDNDSGGRVAADLTLGVSVTFTGGTGDFYVANSANFDGGGDKHNSLGLTDLSGVTQIDITLTYNQFIAGRDSGGMNLDNRPMLSALGIVNGGGVALNNFNVSMSLGGVYSSSTSGGTFTPGVPGAADPLISGGWDNSPDAGLTAFETLDGFVGTVSLGGSDTDFLLVRGYDYDGVGGYDDSGDSPLVYAKSQTWTVSVDSGTMASGTHFVFSLDGQQFSNVANVPEPNVFVLLGAGAAVLAVCRRRRNLST